MGLDSFWAKKVGNEVDYKGKRFKVYSNKIVERGRFSIHSHCGFGEPVYFLFGRKYLHLKLLKFRNGVYENRGRAFVIKGGKFPSSGVVCRMISVGRVARKWFYNASKLKDELWSVGEYLLDNHGIIILFDESDKRTQFDNRRFLFLKKGSDLFIKGL